MKASGIYKIQSIKNPKRIYIGSAVNLSDRWSAHICTLRKNNHFNNKLQNHVNKYGINDLQFSVLVCCEKEDLIKHEQFFIDIYKPYFNIRTIAESQLWTKRSDETKRKIGLKSIGRRSSLGLKRSEETCKKISMAKLGAPAWNKGKKGISEENSKKIAESNKRRVWSDESLKKLSESGKKRWALKKAS